MRDYETTRNAPRKKKAAAKYERYAYILVFRRHQTRLAENRKKTSASYQIFENEADLSEFLINNYKDDAFGFEYLIWPDDSENEEEEALWKEISASIENYYTGLDKYLEEAVQWPEQIWNGKVVYLLKIPLEYGQGIEIRSPSYRDPAIDMQLNIVGPDAYESEEIDHEKYYMTLGEFFSRSNPAPAAVYKVAKTGADLDVDKLITMPEKKAIAIIEEKFGKGTRKAKAMTAFLKMRIKATEGTGNLLRKMPVSNPKSKPLSVTLKKSNNPEKKLMAIFKMDNGDEITRHFGAAGMSDYTQHKDEERMERYLKRHGGGKVRSTKEHWNDPLTAGALSRWILWNKPDLKASFDDFLKRFKLKGELKTKTSVKRAPKRNPAYDINGPAEKNPVEMVGSQPVDVTENFNTVIYRKSRLFDKDKKGNRILRYPKNMQKAAVTITGQENAKVRAGLINGKWAIQAVLIPRKPGLTRVNAVKLADKVMKKLAPKSKPSKLRMNPAFGKEADWQDDVDWDSPPASPEDWTKEAEWDDVENRFN